MSLRKDDPFLPNCIRVRCHKARSTTEILMPNEYLLNKYIPSGIDFDAKVT